VWLLPGHSGPLVLASAEIVTGRTKRPTATEQELYEAIPRRHTNRWPYDDRHPVPALILVAMQHAASRDGGRLRVLGRRQVRTWLRAAHGADRERRDGQGCQPDLAQWTNGGDSGVPAAAFGPPGTFGDDHHLGRHLGRRRGYAPIRDFRPRTDPGTEGADEAEGPGGHDDRGKAETPRFERRPQLPVNWVTSGLSPGWACQVSGIPPSRVTTSPSPASRRSPRFCLALPRCASGARPFAVAMKVAQFVMSSATDDTSTPDTCTIRAAISCDACSSCSIVTACIASQNLR